jgi:sensor c-di-GMP phosphodiesterase-like protein
VGIGIAHISLQSIYSREILTPQNWCHVTHARSRLATAALLLVGAGIGTALGAFVAHSLQLKTGKKELQRYAGRALRDTEGLARELRGADDAVIAAKLPFCSDQELAFMRRIVFYSTTIKDLGRDKNGFLYCTTTTGRLASPHPVVPPDVEDGGAKFYALTPLAIAPDAKGLIGELSGVSFVMNPEAFYSTYDETPMVFTGLFYARDSRRTFYAIGHHEPLSSADVVAERMVEREGIFYQPLCSKVYRVCTVASEPRAAMLAKESFHSRALLISGALLGACIALALNLFYHRQRSFERRLRRAVRKGDLTISYQPIVDLNKRTVIGAEALVRWTNESDEPVPAEVFIELAERKKFIGKITTHVLNRVVEEMDDLLRRGQFHVSVNITMQDLQTSAFFDHLQHCVKSAKVEPASISLELTERSTADCEAATCAIARLKSMGHAVFIDDFGTGYSSLAYLHQLAVNGIKIDRAFTGTVGTGAVTASVVPHILEMASQLELLVIVEGIETEQQADYFRQGGRGIQGQGWFFGSPLPAQEFKAKYCASLNEAVSSS